MKHPGRRLILVVVIDIVLALVIGYFIFTATQL